MSFSLKTLAEAMVLSSLQPTGTATGAVARDYILDPRDLDKRIAPPPPGFRRAGADGSWRVFTRC